MKQERLYRQRLLRLQLTYNKKLILLIQSLDQLLAPIQEIPNE